MSPCRQRTTLWLFLLLTGATAFDTCDEIYMQATTMFGIANYEHAGEVLPGLWVGSACVARDPAWLREHHISFVLSVASEWDCPLNVPCEHFPLRDVLARADEEDARQLQVWNLEHAARRLANEHGRRHTATLVHCDLGTSRSAAVVALYLQLFEQHSYESALTLIRRARPYAQPSPGLEGALRGDGD